MHGGVHVHVLHLPCAINHRHRLLHHQSKGRKGRRKGRGKGRGRRKGKGGRGRGVYLYHVILALLFTLCIYTLFLFDISIVYHWIRQQQTIKLYVIFNILEILEKLCCSFGSEILYALYFHLSNSHSFPPSLHLRNSFIAFFYCCSSPPPFSLFPPSPPPFSLLPLPPLPSPFSLFPFLLFSNNNNYYYNCFL